MRLTRTYIKNLLTDSNLSPKKFYGQNYLCEPNIAEKIVRLAEVDQADNVLEIGPGVGSLTTVLCETGANLLAIEIDSDIIKLLEKVLKDSECISEISIINSDVRNVDWDQVLENKIWKVVANLPYNIATNLILDLLASRPELENYLVMVQKEVAERLVAKPGSRIYGIPSILASFWAELEIVSTISANVFYPKPNVTSALVKIKRKSNEDLNPEIYLAVVSLVKAAFGKRRKQIHNSLSSYFDDHDFVDLSIEKTTRPENLELSDWLKLALRYLEKQSLNSKG